MNTKIIRLFFNNKLLFSFLITTLFFLVSCNRIGSNDGQEVSTDGATPIIVPIADKNDSLRLSSIIDEIELIKLETSRDCPIGTITQVLYDENSFFCYDNSVRQILRFSLDGKFLNNIGHVGRGHGEYFNPDFISLNQSKKEIWIHDNCTNFVKYNYEGNLLGIFDYPISAKSMVFLDKGLCFFTSKNNNYKSNAKDYYGAELTISDNQTAMNRNSLKRYISVSKELYPVGQGHTTIVEPTPFSENDKTITFHYSVSNDIYEVDKNSGEVRVKYYVDFGKANCKADLLSMLVDDMLMYLHSNPKEAGLVNNVIETKDLLYFNFVYNLGNAVYLRCNETEYVGPYVDDIFNAVYKFDGTIDSRTLMFVVDNPSSLKYRPILHNYMSSEQIQLIDNATIDDNPFILLFHIKD